MKRFSRFWRRVGLVLTAAMLSSSLVFPATALAGTTGTISGTITDSSTGAPIANATVSATAPTGSRTTVTDSKGFYVLQALTPDTYAISVTAQGYESLSLPGVTVLQDITAYENLKLNKSLKTIASVTSRSAGSMVKHDTTGDVYNVSGQQLNAIAGGNDLHKTLYQYIAAIPGVTGSGFPAQPRIQGGSAADIGYEFDGIPINERITGLFTTNLSNVGVGNVEVFTGGLDASQAGNGLGIINTVVKTGAYPGVARTSYGTSWEYSNQFETAEYGSATKDHRFSWYFSVDNTNSLNQFSSGQTYPAFIIEQDNGPGVVKTTDLIGNLHYRPNDKNDFQFLIQNGLGEFNFGYLMRRAPGEPVPLTANPCPGAVPDPNTNNHGSWSGDIGGTAPNGQYCPIGLYFGTANTQNGGGNIWHHYSGLGKIQWTHIINDHSAFVAKIAENFNQYVFDQPVLDANLPQFQNSNDFNVFGPNFDLSSPSYANAGQCPAYPYAAGTPIQGSGYYVYNKATKTWVLVNPAGGVACDQLANWFSTGYWQNRMSNMYIGSVDYTNSLSANATIKAGAGYEYDHNIRDVFYDDFFNANNTYPALNVASDFPTKIYDAYVEAQLRHGKWLFSPGLRFEKEDYVLPSPAHTVSGNIWNPTFAFNYSAGRNDVIRGSYTTSNSLVGSEYVYRDVPPGALNGPSGGSNGYCGPQHVSLCNFIPAPTLLHRADLQWEHQFDSTTSMKFGPYYYKTANVYELYTPYSCVPNPSGPGQKCTKAGPAQPGNSGIRKAFGLEYGLEHTDNHPKGIAYWVSATYTNFWTSSYSSLLTPWGIVPLPPSQISRGILVRSSANPYLSGTVTLDAHMDNVHLLPLLYYQSPVTWYTGTFCGFTCHEHGQSFPTTHSTIGYAILNATLLVDLGKNKDLTVGIQGQNILNNNRGVTPCYASTLGSTPSLGLGCGEFWPIGGNQAGANGPGYQFANTAQSTPLFMVFISKRLP